MANKDTFTIKAVLEDLISGKIGLIAASFRGFVALIKTSGNALVSPFSLLGRTITGIQKQFLSLKTLLAGLGVTGLIKLTADFELGMAKVRTQIKVTDEEFARLTEGVKSLSQITGRSLDEVTDGLKKVVAAGVPAEDALGLLSVAIKLSTVGFADLGKTVDILVQSTSQFGKEAKDAGAFAEVLFQASKDSRTDIDQLNISLGRAGAAARAAGFYFDEFVAAVGTLAKVVTTQEAAQGVRAFALDLLKVTPSAREEARKLGIQLDSTVLSGKSLVKLIQDLTKGTGREADLMRELFPNFRAFIALLNLSADNAKLLTAAMEGQANRAGQLDAAFKRILDTLSTRFSQVWIKFQLILLDVGAALTPLINQLIGPEGLAGFLDGILAKRNQVQELALIVEETIKKFAEIIGTLFDQGDVVAALVNYIKTALKLGINLLIDAMPLLVQTVQFIAAELGKAFLKSFFASTNLELARKLQQSNVIFRGLANQLLGEDSVTKLTDLGRQLANTENLIVNLTTAIDLYNKAVSATDKQKVLDMASAWFPRRGKAFTSSSELSKEIASQWNIRDVLLDQITSQDSISEAGDATAKALKESVDIFLAKSKSAVEQIPGDLIGGLKPKSKEAIQDLVTYLTDTTGKLMKEAAGRDSKLADELFNITANLTKPIESGDLSRPQGPLTPKAGFGVLFNDENAKAAAAALSKLRFDVEENAKIIENQLSFLEQKRAKIAELTKEGFLSTSEGVQKDKEALADFNSQLAVVEQQIAVFLNNVPKESPQAKHLELIINRMREIRDLANSAPSGGAAGTVGPIGGSFWTGMEAGIRNTIQALSDFRTVGLQAGQALANTMSQVIGAFVQGKKSFSEFFASFISQIAQMILQMQIFRLISGFAFSGGGGSGATQISPLLDVNTTPRVARLGGLIRRSFGGWVPGLAGVYRDSVPALLAPREYVLPRESTDYYGERVMQALRLRLLPNNILRALSDGVNLAPSVVKRNFSTGGSVSGSASSASRGNTQPVMLADANLMETLLKSGGGSYLKRWIRDNVISSGVSVERKAR